MKIKNRFIILMFSPFLLSLTIILSIHFILNFSESGFSFGNRPQKEILSILNTLPSLDSEKEIIQLVSNISSDFNVELFNEENLIFQNDSRFIIESENKVNTYTSFSKTFIAANGIKYTIILSNPFILRLISSTLVILIISICILVCLITLYTVNKLNLHLKKLEKATEKIASGDYETSLSVDEKDTFTSLEVSINKMRNKIKEEQNRRARFFAGVSHDLKTPLSSIIGYSQALKDGLAEDDKTRDMYLSIIYDKSSLLVQRITSLINYIQITDQGFKTNLKEAKLFPFLQDFCELENSELSLQGAEFEYHLDLNKNYSTIFDPVLLNRALENLIQNAIKYGDLKNPIVFVVSQSYDGLAMALINSNKGSNNISNEMLLNFFEPFYRGDNSRKGKGFGLGLASVKSIVDSHGWKIKAEVDKKENTTTFTIIIPCY
ncbi:MAG: HAMP domain-containing sensor histidine kinase [Sphaerochaetaceae bacterium]|nr:HAMP domain-containing sensor histidine kinase [Sphaerochaetaceae bacterium]